MAAVGAATVAVFGLSVPLSAIMIAAGEAHITQNTLFVGMALLCGFTFPPAYLPDAAALARRGAAVTSALRVLRAATLQARAAVAVLPTCWCAWCSARLYLAVGLRLLGPAERRRRLRGGGA